MAAVKPLMWFRWEYEDGVGGEWEVNTPFGKISVYPAAAPASPTWCWSSATDAKYGYQTAEAAMDAAAEWWEATVTKCLDLNLQIGNVQ